MACEAEQTAVEEFEEELSSLADELEGAAPDKKPHIIARIDATQARLKIANRELHACQLANPSALSSSRREPGLVTGAATKA